MARISPTHPLYQMMAELVQTEIGHHIGPAIAPETHDYLTALLFDFMRTDRLYAIKNHSGQTVTSIIEMLAEGDVRLNADSFDREREVHKHIGDFILFWSGLYPKHLTRLKLATQTDLTCDYKRQGRESYHLVSTFDHDPYSAEAPIFSNLSEGFDDFAFILGQVSRKSGLYAA
ncbi:MAG: hypothetical protein ACKVQS_07530 [Fimbriimonadaceae bacterium]